MSVFGFLGRARPFRAGSWVEVRSAEEILATLDERGCLDGLPFMPEMLSFCGMRLRVSKSAHKSCDTIQNGRVMRRMADAVHLEAVRCDGEAHGGCQAGCLLFWKHAWLKPPSRRASGTGGRAASSAGSVREAPRANGCTVEALAHATRVPTGEGPDTEEQYSCQATELVRATRPLHWWDPRHYVEDLASGNIGIRTFLRYMAIAAFNWVMRLNWRGRPYPYVRGLAVDKTPVETLDLQPGELVQVRSKNEIMRTLNASQKNRGLWFDVEMVPFCNKRYRVLRRVERLINEKNGMMLHLSSDCIILDGVSCGGCLSAYRLFCSRSIYSYWRETWLKRVGHEAASALEEVR